MSDDVSKPPEWFRNAKTFWDAEGRAHALPTWPPSRQGRPSPAQPRPQLRASVDIPRQSGVLVPTPTLPKELLLYYVEAPNTDERWVPMSPVLVQVLTELAAQQGVALDWRAMPPTVSAEKVIRQAPPLHPPPPKTIRKGG